jgi:hypothetical protein
MMVMVMVRQMNSAKSRDCEESNQYEDRLVQVCCNSVLYV